MCRHVRERRRERRGGEEKERRTYLRGREEMKTP